MDMAGSDSARAVKRIENVLDLRRAQFPEDAGPMAHPVRPDSYVEINNFYTATVYEKGAEVVRMMHTLVGREGFARGMTLYFERHDGQAVTCDDFAQAIADANPHTPLAEHLDAFKRWYSQAGTPRLQARGELGRHEAAPLHADAVAAQATRCRAAGPLAPGHPGAGRPAGVRTGRRWPSACWCSPRPSRPSNFDDIDRAPVPSVLRGFSAPVILDDGLDDADLLIAAGARQRPLQPLGGRPAPGAESPAGRAAGRTARRTLDDGFIEAMRAVLRHPDLGARLQGAGAGAAQRGLRRRAADRRRPAAHPRGARAHAPATGAQSLRDDWQWAWEAHQVTEGYRPDAAQSGRRALANRSLSMLVLDAVRSRRSAMARPRLPARQGRRQHDRPLRGAGRAGRPPVRNWRRRHSPTSSRASRTTRW